MSHKQELNETGIRIFPKWLTLIDFEMALAYNLIISRCQDFYLATHNYHTYFKSLSCQKFLKSKTILELAEICGQIRSYKSLASIKYSLLFIRN